MDNEHVTLGEWIVTMLLMIVPFVNIVLLFIWAFGSNTKISKSNWAKATLIMMAVGFVLGIVFSTAMAGIFSSISA